MKILLSLILSVVLAYPSSAAVSCFGRCSCWKNVQFTQMAHCQNFKDFRQHRLEVKKWSGLTEIEFHSANCGEMDSLAGLLYKKFPFLKSLVSLDSRGECSPNVIHSIELKTPNAQNNNHEISVDGSESPFLYVIIGLLIVINLCGILFFVWWCRFRQTETTLIEQHHEEEEKEEESNSTPNEHEAEMGDLLCQLSVTDLPLAQNVETSTLLDSLTSSTLVSVVDRTNTARVKVPTVSLLAEEDEGSSLAPCLSIPNSASTNGKEDGSSPTTDSSVQEISMRCNAKAQDLFETPYVMKIGKKLNEAHPLTSTPY